MMEQRNTSLSLALEWLSAINTQDFVRLLRVLAPGVELFGLPGYEDEHQSLHEWLGFAGLRLILIGAFVRDDIVVFAQYGKWHTCSGSSGEAAFSSLFRVRNGQIVLHRYYDNLDDALEAAGLDCTDEVPINE